MFLADILRISVLKVLLMFLNIIVSIGFTCDSQQTNRKNKNTLLTGLLTLHQPATLPKRKAGGP